MAKINVPFDNKNYLVDEANFASSANALKSHLSSVMNGTGATINFGGVLYNVDLTKLTNARNDFVTHLGKIAGDGRKIVVNGVEYSVDSAKVSNAISDMHTVLGGLQSGGDDDNEDNSNNTIEWNTQDVVGNLSFSTEDMVIVKVSDTILSHEELQASSFVVDNYSYPCETVWHINENVILALYGDMICISASAIGDVPEFGVSIPETGIYALDIATMMGVNFDCKIVVLPIPDAPQSPTAFEITENSITLNWIEGCEYSIDGYYWQDSPIFDNLQSGHKYTFYIRYKGTASNAPSTISSSDIYVDGYVDLAIGSQHIELIGYTNEDEELIIPDIFICEEQNCRFRVTGIQHSGFYGFTNMKSITIPSSVTSIGNNAFNNCVGLTSVVISEGVTSIGESAFRDCTNLTNVVIPNTITNVGRYAFYNCSNLLTVCFNNNNDNGQISTTIGEFAFCDCYKLETVTLPNNLVVLNRGLFFNCESLKNIVIPNSVTSIDSECFQRCKSLTSIAIPDLITMIGYNCFYSCNSLENVTFGKNSCLTDIGGSAFRSCNNLSNIVLPNSVSNIGNDAFGYTNLENIIIPNGVSNLGEDVFQHCTNLSNITIHDNVVSIGRSALYGCNKLTTITIPSSVTTIGQNALGYCTLLSNIIFKGTVEQWNEIEKYGAIHDTKATEVVCSDGTVSLV